MNNFDPILFAIGDKVIAKNKEPDVFGNIPKEEEIINVENELEFSPGKFCQVLYFKSNPKSFELAMNYEPSDPIEREQYYEVLNKSGFSTFKQREKSPKSSTAPKAKTKRELHIKNFLKDN